MVIKETFLFKFVLIASVSSKHFLVRGLFVDHKETPKVDDELTVSPREVEEAVGGAVVLTVAVVGHDFGLHL